MPKISRPDVGAGKQFCESRIGFAPLSRSAPHCFHLDSGPISIVDSPLRAYAKNASSDIRSTFRRRKKIMSTAVAEEKETKLSQLDQLKKFTKVVADTADFESIKDFKPQDATTNPSLVYAATQKQEYSHLLEEVLAGRKKSGLSGHEQIEDICDHLLVQFGTDILEIVPGRVSTETEARLSYNVEGSIAKG